MKRQREDCHFCDKAGCHDLLIWEQQPSEFVCYISFISGNLSTFMQMKMCPTD